MPVEGVLITCYIFQGSSVEAEETPQPGVDSVEVIPGSQLLWKIAPRPANSTQVIHRNTITRSNHFFPSKELRNGSCWKMHIHMISKSHNAETHLAWVPHVFYRCTVLQRLPCSWMSWMKRSRLQFPKQTADWDPTFAPWRTETLVRTLWHVDQDSTLLFTYFKWIFGFVLHKNKDTQCSWRTAPPCVD